MSDSDNKHTSNQLTATPNCKKRPDQIHSFSRKLANEHGVAAALILGYLANRIKAIQKKDPNRNSFFISAKHLAAQYPYVSEGAIAATLRTLRDKNILRAENLNRRKYDRTLWYSFVNPQVQQDASYDPISFSLLEAVEHRVIGAVLLANLRYWINEKRKDNPEYTWHRLSPASLTKVLPFDERTIRRTLRKLAGCVLEARKCPGFDQAYQYRFLDEAELSHRSKAMIHRPELQMHRSNSAMHRTKMKMHRPRMTTYTYLEDSIEKPSLEAVEKENTFINPSAEPPGECVCFASLPDVTSTQSENASQNPDVPMGPPGVHSGIETKEPGQDKETGLLTERPSVAISRSASSGPFVHDVPVDITKAVLPAPPTDQAKIPQLVIPLASLDLTCFRNHADNQQRTAEVVVAARDVNPFGPRSYVPTEQDRIFHRERMARQEAERKEKVRQELLQKARVDAYVHLQKEHKSPFQERESDGSLSPEEKVRVLRAALKSRVRVGAWDEGQCRSYPLPLVWNARGLQMARELFTLNPTVPVSELLDVIDQCCERAYYNNYEGGWDEFFMERRAKNLSFCLKHLEKILAKFDDAPMRRDIVYPGATRRAGSRRDSGVIDERKRVPFQDCSCTFFCTSTLVSATIIFKD